MDKSRAPLQPQRPSLLIPLNKPKIFERRIIPAVGSDLIQRIYERNQSRLILIITIFSFGSWTKYIGQEFHEKPTSLSRIVGLQSLAGLQDDPERWKSFRKICRSFVDTSLETHKTFKSQSRKAIQDIIEQVMHRGNFPTLTYFVFLGL